MPLNLASPGIVIREVDLTVGRADATSGAVGALVAPFAKGPVEDPILITDEGGLLKTFGESYNQGKQYEYWMVASSYLAYGGNMRIVRADDANLNNANAGIATTTTVKIKSTEHYGQLGYQDNTINGVTVAAKNPGSWANDLKVAILDSRADQIISGVVTATSTLAIGYGVTQTVDGTLPKANGTTVPLDGHLKGIITGISGDGSSSSPYEIEVKVLSHVSAASTETEVDYQSGGLYKFDATRVLSFHNGGSSAGTTTTFNTPADWFDQQEIELTGPNVKWNNIVDRPGTSNYAAARNSRFDEVHVVVYDDKGHVTGNAGTLLEKHVALSKAKDAEYSLGSPSYWRSYLYTNSDNLFGGSAPVGIQTCHFSTGFTKGTDNGWDQDAQGIKFAGIGNTTLTLTNGKNYDGKTGIGTTSFDPELNKLVSGYSLFENADNFEVDFLLMGSGNHTEAKAQALASKLIAVAEARQDAIAFISPYRQAFLNDSAVGTVTVNSDSTITDNLVAFYGPITSSSYGVFDSGYKYMYDRFNDTFRYVPLNGDIAGLCARNDLTQFPWFSPAGTARGAILNAVKLPYNPNKVQRDTLYSNRINPVIFSPGEGIVLFGDKTGMAKSSAFDRINVRRLFIYLEDAISAAARDQLFEFNDEITRTNFVNIVEPFLRDVQSKRGIFDYVVVCDETNNTAAVIDNNEFVADIFIKPNRSINFIGLTFVATRTGVSFSEIVGNV